MKIIYSNNEKDFMPSTNTTTPVQRLTVVPKSTTQTTTEMVRMNEMFFLLPEQMHSLTL